MKDLSPEHSELGKKTEYDPHYNLDKLFSIPGKGKRDEIGVPDHLSFAGFDLWNHYEVSWLNEKGKPVVALAEISYSCETPCIIESKSMKLYFNSLNNTQFKDETMVEAIVKKDLEVGVGGAVSVKIIPLNEAHNDTFFAGLSGESLDILDVECTTHEVDTASLKAEGPIVEEALCSNLLKSNCL